MMLTYEIFNQWLYQYGKASAENDPQASAELFSPDAQYYENPFADPLVGREEIYRYWLLGSKTLQDKKSTYEVLAVKDNLGIARWRSSFLNLHSANRIALDCVFLVEFDENQKCCMFREWWHHQVVNGRET